MGVARGLLLCELLFPKVMAEAPARMRIAVLAAAIAYRAVRRGRRNALKVLGVPMVAEPVSAQRLCVAFAVLCVANTFCS